MGGLGDYFRHLMEELVKTQHEFFLFLAPWNYDALDYGGPNCTKILVEEPAGASRVDRLR